MRAKETLPLLILLASLIPAPGVARWEASSAETHLPISIESDDDFLLPVEVNGVIAGSGQEADPYVIAGWDISAASGFAIRIANTSAHVLVKHNHVHDGTLAPTAACLAMPTNNLCTPPPIQGRGIDLFNVSNVTIQSNTFRHNAVGIRVYDSINVSLLENDISPLRPEGRASTLLESLDEFEYLSLLNVGYGGSVGISIVRSSVTVHGNTISQYLDTFNVWTPPEKDYGIYLESSVVTLHENLLMDNNLHVISYDSRVMSSHNTWSNGTASYRSGSYQGSHETLLESEIIMCAELSPATLEFSTTMKSWVSVSGPTFLCGAGPPPKITNNTLVQSTLEISTTAAVENNTFVQPPNLFKAALFIRSIEEIYVIDNVFADGATGALLQLGSGKFWRNSFTNMSTAIEWVKANPTDPTPLLRENCFLRNAMSVMNNTTLSLDARLNWWGVSSGPEVGGPNGVSQGVLFDPWLVEPAAVCA